jgi:hypothetical protein
VTCGHPLVGARYAWTRAPSGDLLTITVRKVSNLWVCSDEGPGLSLARWYLDSAKGRLVRVPSHAPKPTMPPADVGTEEQDLRRAILARASHLLETGT